MARTTVVGACPHDCPDTCSILTTVEDGKAIAVRGNPDHPVHHGRLCVKVNNYEERVYSDSACSIRSSGSVRKGSGQFQRISWDEAIGDDRHALEGDHRRAWRRGDPALQLPGHAGHHQRPERRRPALQQARRHRVGTHLLRLGVVHGLYDDDRAHAGRRSRKLRALEIHLLWACNTLGTNSHHWPFIEQARKAGAKLVVIDPVRTRTARLADWHIPIRPGTDAALALAMIHVIIKENLVDRDYIDKHTVGYDELAERAATYTPEFAAHETGIPVDDIVKLAREYATTPPAVVRIGVAVERHAGGGQTVRAIACLPAIDRRMEACRRRPAAASDLGISRSSGTC